MRVYGTGASRYRRAIVGEGPGWQENLAGSPFVGKTGDELDHHLEINGLPGRRQWWLDNIFDTYQGKDYEWTPDDLATSEPRLIAALGKVRPRLIVTLGRYATRYFLGDVDMDSTEMIPWYLPATFDWTAHPWATDDVVIFPIIHPAAGMHNPEMSPHVVAGFHELKRYLDGQLAPRHLFDDPITTPHYELLAGDDVCRVLRAL